MPLITCPECGKAFSELAERCPNCACPTSAIKGTKPSTGAQGLGAAPRQSMATGGGHPTSGMFDIPDLGDSISGEANSGFSGASGDIIEGKYKLLSPLGAGSFGQVWMTEDILASSAGEPVHVALKFLPDAVKDDAAHMQKVRDNFRKMRVLIHQNIAACIDLAGDRALVMEYVLGITLSKYRQRRARAGGLPVEEALRLASQVADGLDFAHRKGIVHRDIKPDNIVITPEQEVKILDFGEAVEVRDALARIELNERGDASLAGSPFYMAPEQWTKKAAGEACDQYALAAMLHELLSGRPPFGDSSSRAEIERRALAETPAPIPALSSAQNAALLKGLSKRPEDRFAGYGEFVKAVAEAQAAMDTGAAARPPTPTLNAEPKDADTKPHAPRQSSEGAEAARVTTLDCGNGVKLQLALIPSGSFLMGSPSTELEREDNEIQHRVTISKPFYMGIYPVTQEQYHAVMGTDHKSFFQGKNLPVERISWDKATAFCRKFPEKTRLIVRLPTEAEWEYACRAGTITPFYFGDTINASQVNYNGNFIYGEEARDEYRQETTLVGSFPANAWGLHDMHGNVWEWCSDWYGDYPCGDKTDPTGSVSGTLRVLRGGSWYSKPWSCRSACRGKAAPDTSYSLNGFRIALD